MVKPTNDKYDVFLSYHSGDKTMVEELATRLEDKAGLALFLDKWHLIPGAPWQEELEKALDQSRTCAVFLGPSGVGPWQHEEMRSALDRRVGKNHFRVIPVLLPDADPRDERTLPTFLRRMTWVDFRAGLDDAEAFARLVAGIRGEQPGRSMTPQTSSGLISSPNNRISPNHASESKQPLKTRRKNSGDAAISPTEARIPYDDSNSLSQPLVELFSRMIVRITDSIDHFVDEFNKAILAWWQHVTETPEGFSRVVKVILLKFILFMLAILMCIILAYWYYG